MKARQLISRTSYGPSVLKAIGKAFDDAWIEIEPSLTSRPEGIEAARLSLANIVLSLATDHTSDAEALKSEAVRMFRLKRPSAN